MGYIGAHGMTALHRYKYSGVDHSYLAKYVLQPFWNRFVTFFPLWMPILVMFSGTNEFMYVCICACFRLGISTRPNMITLTGFMFLVISALLGFVYSPRLDTPPPRWVHLAHGLLLFLYQTFDAVDGKQARRTNSSSPLGELFDHGCDALACAFETMAFGSTAMCGAGSFWFWAISAIPFYSATWEHYFSNSLILPVVNGPTEGLALIYSLHFMTTIVGAQWWAQPFRQSLPFFSWTPFVTVPYLGVAPVSAVFLFYNLVLHIRRFQSILFSFFSLELPTYKGAVYLLLPFAVLPTVFCNIRNVHKVVKARKGSMLSALAMLYPFVVLMAGVLIWDHLSPSDVMRNYPHLVILGTGLAFGFLVGRMILAHLCDEPKGLKTNMCMSLLYLPLAIANALTARLNEGVPLVDEFIVLLGYCLFTGSLYFHFATSVIREITTALGIYCFRITRKEA
ncbi:Choline/ethanolaminephosphotransferase 1 [Hibiscus syriacus]|uniref:Choline/ethanolaminephosphotransferase 1 n=1 Tax=Hibiscus syriacus TaxID=106335 RepID=A0A6A2XLC9_HIBSY|nr:Choline/ethanolaminephosphotransferase 1 [Hibiscus syriacus]